MVAKNGNVLAMFGVFLDKFGNVLDKFGTVWDYFGNIKTPKTTFSTPKTPNSRILTLYYSVSSAASVVYFLYRFFRSSRRLTIMAATVSPEALIMVAGGSTNTPSAAMIGSISGLNP